MLRRFFEILPSGFEIPIIVVQHLPRGPRLDLELIYGRRGGRRYVEAEDKYRPRSGDVVMAVPDFHLALDDEGALVLSQDEPVHYSRPSIDVFFESAANGLKRDVAAVLLSGANHDGALGLLCVKRAGGVTIVQDPHEAQTPTMPQSALDLFEPDFVGGIDSIVKYLTDRTSFLPVVPPVGASTLTVKKGSRYFLPSSF